MELLDRDVLMSQLHTHEPNSKLKTGLERLSPDWRYKKDTDALKLAKEGIEEVKKLFAQQPAGLGQKFGDQKAEKLQGALNVLIHLRAYGDEEVKQLITDWTNSWVTSRLPKHQE